MKRFSIVLAALVVATLPAGAQEPPPSASSSTPAQNAPVDVPAAHVQQNCDAYYPAQEAATGTTEIAFEVDASGGIRNLNVFQTSGNVHLDEAASSCLNNSGVSFDVGGQRAVKGGAVAGGSASVHWVRTGHSTLAMGCPYPIIPVRLNQQGQVGVSFRISAEGRVMNPVVSKSSGFPELDAMARSCASNFRYTPAMHNGAPIESDASINLGFELH